MGGPGPHAASGGLPPVASARGVAQWLPPQAMGLNGMLATYGTPAEVVSSNGTNGSNGGGHSREQQQVRPPLFLEPEAALNGQVFPRRSARPFLEPEVEEGPPDAGLLVKPVWQMAPRQMAPRQMAPKIAVEPVARAVPVTVPFLLPEEDLVASATERVSMVSRASAPSPSEGGATLVTEQAAVTETEASDEVDNDSDEVAAIIPAVDQEADFEMDNDDEEAAAAAILAAVASDGAPPSAVRPKCLKPFLPEGSIVEADADGLPSTSLTSEDAGAGAAGGMNSGRILMLLLKGSKNTEKLDGAAGALPASLRAGSGNEHWEPLMAPFCDKTNPKRFVNADAFDRTNGVVVGGTGTHPCILKEVPEKDITVMYKPSGWATCSTPHWEGVEGNLIRWVWKRQGVQTAAPCHRLDRGTSGCVLVARSRGSLRHICGQITGRTLVKQYVALVRGKMEDAQGALSVPLAVSSADKPLGACAIGGREAVTRYRVLGYFSHGGGHGGTAGHVQYSLLQVQIDHGRQHQIRLHMAIIGHPVVFDVKYSANCMQEDSKVCSRLFLHAAYVKCTIPPDTPGGPEEPLVVACRLPPQLRRALASTLVRERSFEGALMREARELCDCLLEPDVADAPFEAKLAARRRDEFLRSFSFSKTEREEVVRILAQLPTAEDRSAAMLKFHVNGDRTSQLVVARFEKHVEELLRKNAGKADGAEDGAPAAPAEAEDERSGLPLRCGENGGYGPVSLFSESVVCPACGQQEKFEYVQFNDLKIKLSCRVTTGPVAEPIARLMASAAQAEADAYSVAMHPPRRRPQGGVSAVDWLRDVGVMASALQPEPATKARPSGGGKGAEPAAVQPPNGGGKPFDEKEAQLSAELVKYLEGLGGVGINGPTVASEFASRFNAWIRTDSRRNDGALRRWIGNQPGVTVEPGGGNKWTVGLDPSRAKGAHGKAAEEAQRQAEPQRHAEPPWQAEPQWQEPQWQEPQGKKGAGKWPSWGAFGSAYGGGKAKGKGGGNAHGAGYHGGDWMVSGKVGGGGCCGKGDQGSRAPIGKLAGGKGADWEGPGHARGGKGWQPDGVNLANSGIGLWQ